MAELFERNQVGKREDLANIVAMVDAKDTPVASMIPKGKKPGNTYLQWQADNMPAAVSTGSVDGVDVVYASDFENLNSGRKILSNYVQVFQRPIRVSPLSVDVSIVAGITNELANMTAKGVRLLKRDIEKSICSDNDGQEDNGTLPYLTKALGTWISTTGGSTPAVDSDYRTPTASISTTSAALTTETVVQDVLTSIYGETGKYRTFDCVVGTTMKRAFTNLVFTTTASGTDSYPAIRSFDRDASDKEYHSAVDIFSGDFGKLRLHPSAFMVNADDGYILDMELLELRYSSQPEVTTLPDLGGGPARLLKAVAGLVCKNPLGLGAFRPA